MLLCTVNTTARAHAVSCVCMNGVDSVMSVSIPATVPYEAPDSTAAARMTTDSGREVTDSLYISDRDTIRYKYTPLADSADETEPAAQVTDTIPARKPNFFKRVIDYFGKSAEDKTFEKRMDFTVVGGPSYSSKTSLSIGILAARTVPRRPQGFDHLTIECFGICQRVDHRILLCWHIRQYVFQAGPSPNRLRVEFQVTADRFLGIRI